MDCINHEECKNKNLDQKQIIICDECAKAYCKLCAGIAPTEMRVIELTKRKLRYYCPNCSSVSNKIEQLNKKLTVENNTLKRNLYEQTIIIEKLRDLEREINKTQEVFTQTLEQTTEILKLNYLNEIAALKNEIKNIRDSNVDLVRLLTANQWNRNRNSSLSQEKTNIDKENAHYETNTKTEPSKTNQQKSYVDIVKKTTNKNDVQKETIATKPNQRKENQGIHRNQEDYEKHDSDDGYQEIKKRRRRKKVQLGTNEKAENEFEGRPMANIKNKKIWLFISRVKDAVSTENVVTYIKKKSKLEDEKISVKNLDTWYKVENNKCFLVGVDPTIKDLVYSASFWPTGVAYERFDFVKGQRFLDNQKTTSGNIQENNYEPTTEQNESFLT